MLDTLKGYKNQILQVERHLADLGTPRTLLMEINPDDNGGLRWRLLDKPTPAELKGFWQRKRELQYAKKGGYPGKMYLESFRCAIHKFCEESSG